MGRWDNKWSDAHKQAVGSAMLDPNPVTGKPMTGQQAVDALNAGQLGIDPPPEPMKHRMSYECAKWERARRHGDELSPAARIALEDPQAVVNTFNQRIVSIHERQIEKLEAQIRKGSVDPRLYSIVLKNHREVIATLKPSIPTKHRPAPKNTDRTPDPPSEDAVAQLAKAHAQTRKGTTSGSHSVERNGSPAYVAHTP